MIDQPPEAQQPISAGSEPQCRAPAHDPRLSRDRLVVAEDRLGGAVPDHHLGGSPTDLPGSVGNMGRVTSLPRRSALTALLLLATGSAPASAEAPTGTLAPAGALTALVELSAERLLLADKVAAAKFGTSTPIADPVREQQVLDQATTSAAAAGVDATAFIRAQIEMSKLVQQSLFDRWTTHPDQAPADRPDLTTEVRPALDRITGAFIVQLAATKSLRAPTARCHTEQRFAVRVVSRHRHLDTVHARALRGAAAPICPEATTR